MPTPPVHAFSFPRRCHLKSAVAIRRIIRSSRSGRRRWNGLRVTWLAQLTGGLPTRPAELSRFAFVVSRRLGPAHVRNLVKRRLREAIRLNRDSWPTAAVIISPDSDQPLKTGFTELTGTVREILIWIRQHPTDRTPESVA